MDSIIFDVDGTLWDSTHVIAKAWDKLVKEQYDSNMNITSDVLKSHFGKTLPNIAKALFVNFPEEKQLSFIQECCDAEHKALLETPPQVYEGLAITLEQLALKYPLYIVSNCQAGYIEVFLEATGLGTFFKDHLCPGDTGLEKADNIKTIIQRNHLKNPVYIGDTLGDQNAAKEANVPFIFASYGFGHVENPDYIIHKPTDLLTIL